jgi:hypothetical protein
MDSLGFLGVTKDDLVWLCVTSPTSLIGDRRRVRLLMIFAGGLGVGRGAPRKRPQGQSQAANARSEALSAPVCCSVLIVLAECSIVLC